MEMLRTTNIQSSEKVRDGSDSLTRTKWSTYSQKINSKDTFSQRFD